AGSVSFIRPDTKTRASIAGRVDAGGNVIVTADGDAAITVDSGTASFGTSAGAAASVAALVKNDETEAFLADTADVTARGNGTATTVKTGLRDVPGNEITRSVLGLWVGATSEDIVLTTVAGGQNSGTGGAAGSLIFSVLNETTRAYLGPGARVNVGLLAAGGLPLDQSVRVWAASRTVMNNEAGADVAGNVIGAGAGVDFLALTKLTEAKVGGTVEANRDVETRAFTEEDLTSRTGTTGLAFVTAFGGAAGAHALEITSKASIADGANVRAEGSVVVTADAASEIDIVTGDRNASTGAAGGASASAVVIDRTTEAFIGTGAQVVALGLRNPVEAHNGAFNITFVSDVTGGGDVGVPNFLDDLFNLLSFILDNTIRFDVAAVVEEMLGEAAGDFVAGILDLTSVGAPPEDDSFSEQRRSRPGTTAVRGVAVTATARDDVEAR
ncbi:MAG: hypothetical protein L0227_19305, partial [Chloroflexi bacterium]|nr:hypothetical protein [Chloroflexota bacterium]